MSEGDSAASGMLEYGSPLVSVIIPVFNGAETIRRTLDSALAQTYPNKEIIVVDDGSTDRSLELVRGYGAKIQLLQPTHGGVSSARNHGMRRAAGKYVAFLDQDDYWVPEKLEIQIPILERYPSVGLTFSNLEAVNSMGEKLGFTVLPPQLRSSPSWEDLATNGTIILESTVLARRELMLKMGGFDSANFSAPGYGERDFVLRLRQVADFYYLDMCLAYYSYDQEHWLVHLTNLPIFARKYWNHPWIRQNANGRMRDGFVRNCRDEVILRMRVLLRSRGNKVSQEMLTQLNGIHEAFRELFGDSYRRIADCGPIDLSKYELNDATRTLLFIYLCRDDLQAAYPEVGSGSLSRLVAWAYEVTKSLYRDGDRPILLPYIGEFQRMTEKQSIVSRVSRGMLRAWW